MDLLLPFFPPISKSSFANFLQSILRIRLQPFPFVLFTDLALAIPANPAHLEFAPPYIIFVIPISDLPMLDSLRQIYYNLNI